MADKLIVVSNRIPAEEPPSGGLVVALHDTLLQHGGIWIGAHPERPHPPAPGLIDLGGNGYRRLAFQLSEAEHQNYYLGFANSVLWPVCHRRGDLVSLDRGFAESYQAVNARLAREIAKLAAPETMIWIHDYHFFPLGIELRKLGVTSKIGFFLHIPFPALGDLGALPDLADVPRWLAAYDLAGLQTKADVARCFEMFRAEPDAEILPGSAVKYRGRRLNVRDFPIGIDVDGFVTAAEKSIEPGTLGPDLSGDILIGVDRLDYSKGLPNRFLAFGRYLERRPKGTPRVSLLQIAPPTREEVEAYRQIRQELEEIAGRLNGEYSDLDWTPLRYIHRPVGRGLLAKLYRRARAGLVTPFADGMNLVAKEYVAAQNPDDPGVLILSRMAGAAEDLQEALLVNPYDIEDMTVAIERALSMPLEERQARYASCMQAVRRTDVSYWSKSFLEALAG
ncbi:alpha,alpha-trehalose-phosphate synthase (UDP-forming) (plasmid) [Roseobacteraceae bacterium NS-SX3]